MRLLPLLLLSAVSAHAVVNVYPVPDNELRSRAYNVKLIQNNQSHDSFVYSDENDSGLEDQMTDFNHWTSFDFEGQLVVEVTVKAEKEIRAVYVHPYRHRIKASIRGNKIRFLIKEPGHYFVRFEMKGDSSGDPIEKQGGYGYENPLFIFANAPEEDIPITGKSNVVQIEPGLETNELRDRLKQAAGNTAYFEPGVHRLNEKFEVHNGTDYYLAPGSYVIGNLIGDRVNDVRIFGRGILSLKGFPRHGSAHNMDWNLINFGRGKNQSVEGITLTNPSHFCILSRGQMHVDNVKMFGWHYQTDGFGADDGSSIRNSFMKVNDDNVKVYNSDCTAENLVVYQQKNGAIFQHSWGADDGSAENWNVSDIHVVQSDAMHQERSLIEMKEGSGRTFSNFTFERITCDQDLYNLFAFDNKRGTVGRLLVRDVNILGKLRRKPYIHSGRNAKTQIVFKNLKIAGKSITKASQLKADIKGKGSSIKFMR